MSLEAGSCSESTNEGVFVQFNQDCTSLVLGSSKGYHLYALNGEDDVEEIYASDGGQEVCLVDRLFSSSLVAIVKVCTPRKLTVCHYKKCTEICNYTYSNTILAVKLNRSRLVVCLEESLHVHNIRDMKVLHTIRDTPPNPRGLCALSPSVERCYLAYPGSSTAGEVQVFDAVHMTAKCVVSAHNQPLAALAWSQCGARLATASERGTVIRVFLVPERLKLYEFRRGVVGAAIACLAFSACGRYLANTSSTETVHVFRLGEAERLPGAAPSSPPAAAAAAAAAAPPAPDDAGWVGWLQAAVSAGATYLPATVANMADALYNCRDFSLARLPRPGRRAVVAITEAKGARGPRLLVATSEGMLYVYALDPAKGGECTLLRTHALLRRAPADCEAASGSAPAPGSAPDAAPASDSAPAPAPAEAAATNSYAGALRGRDPAHMTDSERESELSAAAEGSPPRGPFDLRDPRHFPPMRAAPAPAPAPAPAQ